jgi:uncharacterized tellurite resistance protein B-like protein
MKPSKSKLYDALGELIYAVAKADGAVQPAERQKLLDLLKDQSWGADVAWSFDYEDKKALPLQDAYHRALDTCKAYGPAEEYAFLFKALQEVAEAHEGVEEQEKNVIFRFTQELRNHFLDLDL